MIFSSTPIFPFATLPTIRNLLRTGAMALFFSPGLAQAQAATPNDPPEAIYAALCAGKAAKNGERIVCADVAALDQTLVYNRFGSFNPYGMIFALTRDLDRVSGNAPGLPDCDGALGTEAPLDGAAVGPGEARLRDCKRPRPLVLRANVGDILVVRVTNLLTPARPDFSGGMCAGTSADPGREATRRDLSRDTNLRTAHGEVACSDGRGQSAGEAEADYNWPRTRNVNFVAQGLEPLPVEGEIPRPCLGTDAVPPGESFTCRFRVGQEGTHFLASHAAASGGEGDGGSIVHGLFGAVMAERPGTRWYRSQVSQTALDATWPRASDAPRHARQAALDYEAIDGKGVPLLNMARALDVAQADFATARRVEIVHTDLNAIVYCDETMAAAKVGPDKGPLGCAVPTTTALGTTMPEGEDPPATLEPDVQAFREFTVFFHDELKTFYTRNFEELGHFGQLAGVRDGFAINYGASGMGSLLLANRKGIGPAASCAECLYEEFFLTSWANGDPALLEWFSDDPSNVHHSYLNDPVVFRNFHAGPKETHVFHLHAHQWFAGNDPGRGSYLDSQTVGPQQGFTYNIYHGGRPDGTPGHWSTGGSGNRNRTVGDSIFHCHLYPHFAQGMWALWRVHDVFEDGTRRLPDGQLKPGLSTYIRNPDEAKMIRPGSVDSEGAWIAPDKGKPLSALGTPVPALVPLPGEPLPPLPTYTEPPKAAGAVAPQKKAEASRLRNRLPSDLIQRRRAALQGPERLILAQATVPAPEPATGSQPTGMPGYPFYIAGRSGHRPPQAPYDIARDRDDENKDNDRGDLLSGGLGRNVVVSAQRHSSVRIPAAVAQHDKTLAAGLSADPAARAGQSERELERLRAQVVAKAVAMGDMTTHLADARIQTLPPEGTPLERAAMAFHYDGAGLRITNPDGTTAGPDRGGYTTLRAPLPGAPSSNPTGLFEVNGSAPKPGAPFADPCGIARDAAGTGLIADQFTGEAGFLPDPKLLGFRRYKASAVQLDLVVNKAGWHDPQARINVMTANSDHYKDGGGQISPRISDRDEPFFFRALSGECLEFRHTNELPKDLALDDFQVRTPTDTIGQHIHLVKFDVTSSDGSGNGWNYEDGTLAADEIMARRCAAGDAGLTVFGDDPSKLKEWGTRKPIAGECAALEGGHIWRKKLTETTEVGAATIPNRDLFQTTVQRWFADPILTKDGTGKEVDRTMRTVFSHDHFGPSSIQQHGFYSALLIEPAVIDDTLADAKGFPKVCPVATGDGACEPLQSSRTAVADAKAGLTGAARLIQMGKADPLHPSYREFALAIADFALLYDPRDRQGNPPDVGLRWPDTTEGHEGLAQILCEADYGTRRDAPGMNRACGSGLAFAGGLHWAEGENVPPAWVAAGRPGDYTAHQRDLQGNLFLRIGDADDLGGKATQSDRQILRQRLIEHRFAAAYPTEEAQARADRSAPLAKPVAAPLRPESISVDHHDPYLLNYRMAAVPLRLGTKNSSGQPSPDCALYPMSRVGDADSKIVDRFTAGELPPCSYAYQLAGLPGDAGFAFSSRNPTPAGDRYAFDPARDPETPVLEAYQNDRIVFRLIQGAQEVQHVFNVAGLPFRRNIDQVFGQAMRPLASITPPAKSACFAAMRRTHPEEYDDWLDGKISDLSHLTEAEATAAITAAGTEGAKQDRWRAFAKALARCDNPEGMVFAQEVGISEHFELRGRLRQDVALTPEAARTLAAPAVIPDKHRGHPDISDYLYNFGTVDSLWNGDWGLLRIYRDAKAADVRLGEATDVTIGARLRPLEGTGPSDPAEESVARQTLTAAGLPTCPQPMPGRDIRYSTGYVVALRTGEVPGWRNGTPYGLGQFDRDGLMLALLPDLPGAPDAQEWGAVDKQAVLRAVADLYDRPEPFVMRVNAGDCVVLRFVNTLSEPEGGKGIQDLMGDALLPPITPLNADLIPATLGEFTPEGTLTPTTTPETGLRPSARLALTLGLPGGSSIDMLPSGFGLNAAPMEPVGPGGAPISPEFAYYAGRAAYRGWKGDSTSLSCLNTEAPLADQLDLCVPAQVHAQLPAMRAALGLTDAPALRLTNASRNATAARGHTYIVGDKRKLLRLSSTDGAWTVRADGEDYRFDPAAGAPDLATLLCPPGMAPADCTKALQTLARQIAEASGQTHVALADSLIHWIPYAYGPVPLRVTGDMISQTVHGLAGIVDVVPEHWRLPDAVTETAALDPTAETATRAALAAQKVPATASPALLSERAIRPIPGFGQGLAYQVSLSPQDEPGTVRLREFVLMYQDGLNLRDSRSNMVWRRESETGNRISFNVGPPVPDCFVCDDSYDRGEQGVSYRSAGHVPRLREFGLRGPGGVGPERHMNLNAWEFPPDYFTRASADGVTPLTLQACQGEQVVIRINHPGGRARQRAFAMNGLGYDDLFPGFGFPNAALLAPGKSVSAWLTPREIDANGKPVSYIWSDGPLTLTSGGTWGLLEMLPNGAAIGNGTCG